MTLFDISLELKLPVKVLRDFLQSKNISNTSDDDDVSDAVYNLITNNVEEVRKYLVIENIEPEKIQGPKVLGKVDLFAYSNEKSGLTTTPRLMAAAKEFNIGKDTLVDYLVSRGYNSDYLKPTAKLSEEMYWALVERFQPDRLAKIKSDSIPIQLSSPYHDITTFKGFVEKEIQKDTFKINFVKSERTYRNGKPVVVEVPDRSNWITAKKENWGDYTFKSGDKIVFSISKIDKDGKKIRTAVPPFKKSITSNSNIKNESAKRDIVAMLEGVIPFDLDSPEVISDSVLQTNTQHQISTIMNASISPLQKILFGSPGTGKSYQIVDSETSYYKQLIVDGQKPDLIKTVFHPEYTYGDFMGKLMPLTNRGKVEYRYYSGHFLLALGTAYKNIIKAFIEYTDKIEEIEKDFKSEVKKNKSDYSEEDKAEVQRRISEIKKPAPKNVLLVIDEINRGNSAAIFGTVFQLLDRDNQGWSSYPVKISDLELKELLNVTGLYYVQEGKEDEVGTRFCGESITRSKYDNYLKAIFGDLDEDKRVSLPDNDIKMPPNLSIIATMNTSDNSIYFMDSAFKRRWDWEFVDITSPGQKESQSNRKLEDGFSWDEFVDNLNTFIKKYGERIRKIEDKQIGYYFIKGDIIKHEAIRNKLMFFLWDSIFNNDKKPIKELIGTDKTLVTFGDFIKHYDAFITAIKSKSFMKDVL